MEERQTERNRIVAHFKDGRLLKGFTHDFTPVKDTFHLTSELERDKGQIYEVFCPNLKAKYTCPIFHFSQP